MCFRLLRGLFVYVYLCEHLALALSHLDSLRHAGETNTNALQAAGNVCLGWPGLSLLASLAPTSPCYYGAPTTPTPLSRAPSCYTLTSVAATFFLFFARLKRTFRCCWLLLPLILAVYILFIFLCQFRGRCHTLFV